MKLLSFLLFALSAATVFASEMPEAGISQQQVLKQLGEPSNKIAPVGQPAISRWVYSGFTVYFEKQRVIHSVQH